MIIEDINSPEEVANVIRSIEADMKAITKAIASFKKNKALIKKVAAAQNEGRIDATKATAYYNSIREDMKQDLLIIQERGFCLGQGDLGADHEAVAEAVSIAHITR